VKRFFSAMFLEGGFHELELLDGDEAAAARGELRLDATSAAGRFELRMCPTFGHGLVQSLVVEEVRCRRLHIHIFTNRYECIWMCVYTVCAWT